MLELFGLERSVIYYISSSHCPLPFVSPFDLITSLHSKLRITCFAVFDKQKQPPISLDHQLILCKFSAFLSEIGTIFKFDKAKKNPVKPWAQAYRAIFGTSPWEWEPSSSKYDLYSKLYFFSFLLIYGGLGSWIGFLGLVFSVDGVLGLWCGAFLVFWGWGSVYIQE